MGGFLKRMARNGLGRHVSVRARHVWTGILNQLLPPRCLACGVGVQDAGRLCGDCWGALDFLQGPACACCGYPFEGGVLHLVEEHYCAACQANPPAFDRARMALRYDEASRGMILAFKHGDRLEYGPFLADLLGQAYGPGPCPGETFPDNTVVLPVPLHRKRLRRRRYNQAAIMGQIFARNRGFLYLPEGLRRIKHTPPQHGNSAHRLRNVAGAFVVSDGTADRVRGQVVILVDDVYTTGATVKACARILKRHGAARVEVLTIARVCRPRQI